MKAFGKLFSRNMKLTLGNVWRRELIMLVLCVIAVFQYAKIGQRPLFSDVMQGISDFRGNPYFPMSWFLIVIFNQVVIGDSFRKLILHDYPLVASISLGRYLFCSVLNLFSVGGANVLLLLVMTRHHPLHFAWTAAFCLLLFLACFAFLTLIFSPVICEGLVVIIAVLTIFADGMPFFGRLMFVRGTAILPGDVLAALLMLIIIAWCGFRIKQLDFI